MTSTVILLVALYAVWRAAGFFGRRREREYETMRNRVLGGGGALRCARCGRELRPEDAKMVGPVVRRVVCARGCRSESLE